MKLSIIVPVYNAEKYLDRTIKNILEQTFTDFELLLIDDGSKDSSGFICDNWSKKDSRGKVIHQENTGVGGARNSGLDVAQGEYIGFVDNDDLIHPQMYEILLGVADKENADIVMSFAALVNEDTKLGVEQLDLPSIHYQKVDTLYQYSSLYSSSITDGLYRSIWNKIYKKSLIGNVRFPLIGAEDAVASLKVGNSIKSEGELIISGKKGYIYVPTPWWKTDYFEVRYEDSTKNRRYFYQLDGEGIRFEIIVFLKMINGQTKNAYVSEKLSVFIANIFGVISNNNISERLDK